MSEMDDVDSTGRESGREAAAEWHTDTVTGAVPGAQGPPVGGGGSAGAETHAGGERHFFWHASSRSDVVRAIVSQTGDVDSTGRESACEAATEWRTDTVTGAVPGAQGPTDCGWWRFCRC